MHLARQQDIYMAPSMHELTHDHMSLYASQDPMSSSKQTRIVMKSCKCMHASMSVPTPHKG